MHSILLIAFLAAESSNWWTNYGDPELNRIIDKILASNMDLQVATERIAEARALAGGAKSKLGPSINANSSAQRLRGGFAQNIVRIPQASGAEQSGSFVSPFETGLLQAGLDMKWELDFFGTNRAGYAAAKADALVEEQRQQDLAIIVSAEAARYYFELRGIEERIAITGRNIKAQRDLLSLTTDRAKAGLASQLDIEQQSVLLLNTEANLPPLRADLALHLNRLAVLMGEETFARPRIAPATKSPEVPTVSAAIPGEILKRRPDVRAAEARLAAAMSRLKQARTDLYPKIALNGLVGRQSTSFTTISLGSGNFFNVGPQLVLPWFNFGKIKSNIAANDARVKQERLRV